MPQAVIEKEIDRNTLVSDLARYPGLRAHRDLFTDILTDSSVGFWLVSYPYGHNIVEGGNFNYAGLSSEFRTAVGQPGTEMPIGLCLDRTLEVSAAFRGLTDVPLRLATTLLYPGDFFGLFENFTKDVRGKWDISAGVMSFLILEPFGDSKTLKKAKMALESGDLQWTKKSSLSFHNLIEREAAQAWQTQVLFLPKPVNLPDSLQRLRYETYLMNRTVGQLSRVITGNHDQLYTDNTLYEHEIQTFRNLVQSTLHGSRVAYYIANPAVDSDANLDLPFAALLDSIMNYDRRDRTALRWTPILVPGLAQRQLPARFGGRLYHLLDLEPSIAHRVGGPSGLLAHVPTLFPYLSTRAAGDKRREIDPWLKQIPLQESEFRDIVHRATQPAFPGLTEGRFNYDYGFHPEVIVRWYFNPGPNTKGKLPVRNGCDAQWLPYSLYGELPDGKTKYVKPNMITNILEVAVSGSR